MFSSPIFTVLNIVSFLLLVTTIVFQIIQMKYFGIF